jgi:DNA replication licensing factor MCM7
MVQLLNIATNISTQQLIANRTSRTLNIHLDDIIAEESEEFATRVISNAFRYRRIFAEIAEKIMPEPTVSVVDEDVIDILYAQRRRQNNGNTAGAGTADEAAASFPPELRRRFEVLILPPTKQKQTPLREVKSAHIGHLVSVRGIVTRVTEVKPQVVLATYTCDQCGFEIYQEVTGKTFLPKNVCESNVCKANSLKGRLHLQTRGSKFLKYQEVKIQEPAEEVPVGHIPRSITVVLKGSMTRTTSPGDFVTVSGIFLPTPFTGRAAQHAGLQADTLLEAMSVERSRKHYSEYVLTDELIDAISVEAAQSDIYAKLAESIAPEIYGLSDVKKALLLLLVGAPTLSMEDGMRIRGNLHICLMGDPGVAKSQLLRHIAKVAPRGVYTTGKGSSGVGLTAALLRDTTTHEFVLEGGALVLADRGICCIDEFDKMEESDRTAIHEVMEQETVSVAKAGITTSLNARTAVLAAANPAFGRYRLNRSVAENINLPAALLSRFDLLFLMIDKADAEADARLAAHITHVHRFEHAPESTQGVFDSTFLSAYIAQARKMNPTIPPQLMDYLCSTYVALRAQSDDDSVRDVGQYTTARTLLAILRLSQALARVRFSDTVAQSDVEEALRLMNASKSSLSHSTSVRREADVLTSIYRMVRDFAERSHSRSVGYDDVLKVVLMAGRSQMQFAECLEEYASLGVWAVDDNRTQIRFLDA